MIAFLAIIYAAAAWLVFFKFKLLPFDLRNKIATVVLGLLFVCGILIAVNFFHPMTLDARVFQHVVQIAARVPQPSRVVEVPVEPNKPLKQGDVLFRVDPRPYQYEVDRLTAAVASAEQSEPQLQATLAAAQAGADRIEAERALAQSTLNRDTEAQRLNPGASTAQRLDQEREQVAAAEAGLREAQAQAEAARVSINLLPQTIAQAQAQLAAAQLNLDETTVTAPADGFVTVLELRPGFVVAPGQALMSFVVEPEGVVAATLAQEFSRFVKAGDEAEVCLDVYPGKTLHGTVEAVIQATGEGQLSASGVLPTTGEKQPRARVPIKIRLSDADRAAYPIPAGAGGAVAVYTDHGKSFGIVRRVMLRWYTWLNYIKLSL
jgi:multidrug resistance efflux pump